MTDSTESRSERLSEMPFLSHLDDLRRLLIQSGIAVAVLTSGCWFFSRGILNLLIGDLPVDSLYFQSPVEAFMIRLKVSFVVGVLIAFPFVLFRAWAFISPGMFVHERKRIYPLTIASAALFYLGVGFCYVVLIPVVLKFLLSFGTDFLNPLLSVSHYFSFVARLCFSFGVVFQIPVVVLLLSSLGLVSPRWLLKQWRYSIVIIFAASAILTPPDPISLLLMALPIVLLYLASVVVAFTVARGKRESDRAGES